MDITKENFENYNQTNSNYLKFPAIDYEDHCDRFRIDHKTFQTQYFPYYNARVELMNKIVEMKAKNEWGDHIQFSELNELNDTTEDQKICLIGVIFKYLEKHPTILKEVSEEYQLDLPSEDKKFTSENDFVMLQQGKDTIRLTGEIEVDKLVNGVMVALIGHNQDETNSFKVDEYCFAGPIASIQRPIIEQDQFVVLISGLGFSKDMPFNLVESLNGLTEYLIGFSDKKSAEESSQIVKLIIAGNCISKKARQMNTDESTNNQYSKKQAIQTTEIMQIVDDWIFELAKFIEVDIMPGEYDAASVLMPQQPLHIGVLPKCSSLESVKCLTNPYAAKINGTFLIGCSGQTVDSIRSYSSYDETLDILKQKLIWNHLAPTAPDALFAYPFIDKDPFVIDECPHILFAGNQDHFNTQIFKNNDEEIRLVSVPSFEEKLTCVLINLKDLKCSYMAFN